MKQNILFITASSNWPLTDGKCQRTWFLLEALSKEYIVDVLLISYQKEKGEFNITSSSVNELFFIEKPNLGFSKINLPNFLLSKKYRIQKKIFFDELNDFFDKLYNKNKYTFLFSRYIQPLMFFSIPEEVKVICDIDDVYFETQKSKIQIETNFTKKLKYKVFYFFEAKKVKKLINRIDIPIVVKESDRSFYGLKNAICMQNLPFSVFINQEENPIIASIDRTSSNLSFGFIGKLSFKPNYQGLINFINLIWNPLMESKFDARLVIAGSGTPPTILETTIKASKNIDFIGFVKTPELFWNRVSALLVPITMGGGSNIKIAEAFMNGKSVISYPFASRGYETFINTDYLTIAENSEELISIMRSFEPLKHHESQLLILKAKELYDLQNWSKTLLNSLT